MTILFLAFLGLNIALFLLSVESSWLSISIALTTFVFLFFLQFFRNPARKIEVNEKQILAPADGKVVVIEKTTEPEYFNGEERMQVSIFMSPINVHVNRNPVTGLIKYFKYHPGKYLVAWHPKSSTENERTTVVYELHKGVEILIRQIAGIELDPPHSHGLELHFRLPFINVGEGFRFQDFKEGIRPNFNKLFLSAAEMGRTKAFCAA